MQRISTLTLSVLLFSASTFAFLTSGESAFAASMSQDCVSLDKNVQIAAGNSGLETYIKYVDKDGRPAELRTAGNILPEFDYNEADEKAIFAIPVSEKTELREKHQTMKVTRKDGTFCYGRQAWDDTWTQTFVVTGRNGRSLKSYDLVPFDAVVRGMTAEGYVVTAFACRAYGITTAGGCFVEDDSDLVEWIDDDKLPKDEK